jgi:hypothetical protein
LFWTFGIQPPTSVNDLFNAWLSQFDTKLLNIVLVGVSALLWSLWLCRNDMVFNKTNSISILQVVFRSTYWARTWSMLLKDEESQEALKLGCRRWEMIAREILTKFGWRYASRIEA